MSIVISNNDLFMMWLSAGPNNKEEFLFTHVENQFGAELCTKENIKNKLKYFCLSVKSKWVQCSYTKANFEAKYSDWLQQAAFEFLNSYEEPSTSRGRPQKPFSLLSERTKKKRLADILKEYTEEELEFALKCIKKRRSGEHCTCMSLEGALSLFCELDLSAEKYVILRKAMNGLHENCIPSLYSLQRFKKNIVPSVTSSENSAEVKLKPLMERTAKSVMDLCKDIPEKVSLICKWGMDGSSGHSRYKQKFSSEELTDEFMFLIAVVPIKLVNSASHEDIWVNEKCSSTFSCRPVKIIMAKEDKNLIKCENDLMEEQIRNLESDIIEFNGKLVEVSYVMHCTMIDGAVANILTETYSSSRCFICKATPTEMNKPLTFKAENPSHYKFGLSTLHCWIRFMECLLHISYRLPFKKWQVRPENKTIFGANKKQIQHAFRERMGLLIDYVKQGYGTTNDGNTARTFFLYFEESADITGLNKDLVYNFALVLRILSCGSKIKIEEFNQLLTDTRNLYLELYNWYYMPSSVHKVLFHGCDVIKYFDMPIGLLFEEALEATHKTIRHTRLHHTRKVSRESSNMDLITHLLLSSDPKLVSMRKNKYNKQYCVEDPYVQNYILNEEDCEKNYEDN